MSNRRAQLTEHDMAIIQKWMLVANRIKDLTYGVPTGKINVYGIDTVFLGVIKEVNGNYIFVKA